MAAFINGGLGGVGSVGGRGRRSQPAGPVQPNVTINADGWSATWNDGTPPTFDPDGAPLALTVNRAGFTSAAAPTTIPDTVVFTARERTPHAAASPVSQLSADQVAVSDYVYDDDEVPDRTNNSTKRSPKPVAQWVSIHRDFVTDRVRAQVVCGHKDARNNRQVACVKFIASDGTLTVTQTISTVLFSQPPRNPQGLEVIECDIDVSTLADGRISLDGEVYPFFGVDNATYSLSSVRKSVDETLASTSKVRGFCTRYFRKRAAGRPIAYVNSAGTATASSAGWTLNGSTLNNTALQFPTLRIAVQAMSNAANTGVTGGVIEGEIRVMAGTYQLLGDTVGRPGGVGALIITRDPREAIGNVIVTYGSGIWTTQLQAPAGAPNTAAVIVRDITLRRTGSQGITTASGNLEAFFENVEYDTQGNNTVLTGGANQWVYINGMRVTNSAAGGALSGMSLAAPANRSTVLLRGVEADMFFNSANQPVECYNMHGCRLFNVGALAAAAAGEGEDNMCMTRNIILGLTRVVGIGIGSTVNTNGAYIAGNLYEVLDDQLPTPANTAIRSSADDGIRSQQHVIFEANTFIGAQSYGRMNVFYTDGAGGARTFDYCVVRGHLGPQVAVKSDLDSSDGARVGNWQCVYGVGWRGNHFYSVSSAASNKVAGFFSLAPEFIGLNSFRTDGVVDWVDPLFTNYQGIRLISGVVTPGAGGGTYTLQAGSPARNRITSRPYRSFDLAGNAVGSTDNAGAYI